MVIIGCDYHPSMQQAAWVDTETGECGERQLRNHNGELIRRPAPFGEFELIKVEVWIA